MSEFLISGTDFLDGFSHPILWARDGKIAYLNEAARRVLDDAQQPLTEGMPLPSSFPTQGASMASVVLGKDRWTVEAREVKEGVVYHLTPAPQPNGLDAGDAYLLSVNLKLSLSTMLAALESLQNEMVETELERNHERFATLNQGYFRLLHTVDSLSLYSLFGQEPEDCYHPEALDLTAFCGEMEEQLAAPVRLTGHVLTLKNHKSPLFVAGDRQLLERMICQLCANGVKAGGDVELRLRETRKRAVLTVTDTGRGIADAVLNSGFGTRATGAGTFPTGVGLGLPICRQIVQLHQGSLVITRQKKGTKVVISLPLLELDQGGMPLRSKGKMIAQGFPTVLVELSQILPRSCYDPRALF